MSNQKVIQFDDFRVVALFFAAFVLGALTILILVLAFSPTGWCLSTVVDVQDFSKEEKALLESLILNGSVFSASDLLGNFTSYYHFLVSLLITFLILLGGFVTYNAYKSREEHDDILKNRLLELFDEFNKGIEDEDAKRHLQDYKALHSHLEAMIVRMIDNSDELSDYIDNSVQTISEDMLNEAILGVIEEAVLSDLCSRLECKNGKITVKKKTKGQ